MSVISNVGQHNNTLIVDGSQLRGQKTSEGNLNLKTGDTIKGTVVSVTDTENGKVANINVGDSVISAKLQEGMGLREGQTLNFSVRSSGNSGVSITPLYENTAVSTSALKALTAAGIEVNNDTVQMVKDMMEAGLPIGKDALLEMNRNLSSHPNASISNMVEMKSLGIPVNDNNLVQFQSYKNYEHQVTSAMESIMDELPEAFSELLTSGDTKGALELYGNVLKLFGDEESLQAGNTEQEAASLAGAEGEITEGEVPEGEVTEGEIRQGESSEAAASKAATGELLKGAEGETEGQTAGRILQDPSADATVKDAGTQSLDGKQPATARGGQDLTVSVAADAETQRAPSVKTVFSDADERVILKDNEDTATGKPGSGTETVRDSGYTRASDLPKMPGNDFINTLKSLGISDEAIENYRNSIKTATALSKNPQSPEFAEQGEKLEMAQKNLLKEIAKQFEGADLSNSSETAAWKKLFSGNDYNKLLKDNISSQWLLKPGDVREKENIENLYQRLNTQVKGLANAINGTLGAESKLGQAANNLSNNLDFMNQLNQMFQYVQLPLQMTGQNAHGDLYVYRNKNRKMSEDGSVSAVLHLDMENLGPLDVYVKMKDSKVNTNFYVADESVIDLINDNIHILNERLEKRGYQMTAKMMLHDDMDGQDAAVDEMLDVSRTPLLSINSFDARA